MNCICFPVHKLYRQLIKAMQVESENARQFAGSGNKVYTADTCRAWEAMHLSTQQQAPSDECEASTHVLLQSNMLVVQKAS